MAKSYLSSFTYLPMCCKLAKLLLMVSGPRTQRSTQRRKRGPETSIWADQDYKQLKLQKMEQDLEEQEARIDLLRAQKNESVARALLYEKMGSYYERSNPSPEAPQFSFLVDPADLAPINITAAEP